MQIKYFKQLTSTQIKLQEYIKKNKYTKPICFVTQNQTNGIGSRNNKWICKKGNLFFSFVLDKKLLPQDLPLQSSSIYFSFILKDILSSLGSRIFLKWPNDFYIGDKKIGGTITKINDNLIFCGIGLNLRYVSSEFGYLDIKIKIDEILKQYFNTLNNCPSWKQIISIFEIEFYKTNSFFSANNDSVSLKDAILLEDGSLKINKQKVFSLR
jgi:BirA family biotin operon repressor/biotin-[acetyl-CoA-carboxylase] ligase